MDQDKDINVSTLQMAILDLKKTMMDPIYGLSQQIHELPFDQKISEEEFNQTIKPMSQNITQALNSIIDTINELPEATRTEVDQLQEIKMLSERNQEVSQELLKKIDCLKEIQTKVSNLSSEVLLKQQNNPK